MNEQQIGAFFGAERDSRIGNGWWSGVMAVFCGALAFGAVLCLHFPQILTSPELRAYYPVDLMRLLIKSLIWAALLFALLSSILGKNKRLALTGMVLALAAAGLGGSSVPINQPLTDGPAIGLDWFLLDLFLMALIYVPTHTAPSPPLLIARTTSTHDEPAAIVGLSLSRCIRSPTRNVNRFPKRPAG